MDRVSQLLVKSPHDWTDADARELVALVRVALASTRTLRGIAPCEDEAHLVHQRRVFYEMHQANTDVIHTCGVHYPNGQAEWNISAFPDTARQAMARSIGASS